MKVRGLKTFLRRQLNAVGYDVVKVAKRRVTNLRRFERPADTNFNKIFGIGYNKTATTSLNRIFEMYGFKVPNQQDQERLLTDCALNTDYTGFKGFIEQYDAFQDLPFSQGLTFVACDALFPNSKFILTVRDEEKWFSSIFAYHKKLFGFDENTDLSEQFFKGKDLYLDTDYIYRSKRRMVTVPDGFGAKEDWSLLYDEAHYKKVFRDRNEQIIRYFAFRPDKLLIIDLTKEHDTSKICEFLGLSSDHVTEIPHENIT